MGFYLTGRQRDVVRAISIEGMRTVHGQGQREVASLLAQVD
jgi:hypothetical protein